MKYGLQEIAQELQEYVMGESKVPYIFYNDQGNWESHLPKFEKQRTGNDQETSACSVFASLSQIETMENFLYQKEPNYSERFTYNLVPVEPSYGADPQRTHECIRANGVVDEDLLPMTRSLVEYIDKSALTGSLRAKGMNWLVNNTYMHEWVWTQSTRPDNYIEVLKEALKTSPIAVSVSAWNFQNGVYVSNQGSVNNHYVLLYKIDEEGYPWVFDTYDQSKKKLAKDHNIRRAKRIWINKKTRPAMRQHISILESILKALKLMNPTLLDVCRDALGTDVTPADKIDDSVACVDTASTLLRKVRPETPYMVSTVVMNAYLANPAGGYVRVDTPEPEDIIITPTEGKRIGHVGFFMDDLTIASNNSFGVNRGKFTKNYTLPVWNKRYKDTLGLSVFIYRKL